MENQNSKKLLNKFRMIYKPSTKEGYINANLPWFSSTDLHKTFGLSRQYWEKLIKQGKLLSSKTSAGSIVTTEDLIVFIEEYGE